ncbi:MAG TPA: Gmad2 immunoglobulin-like domain-containing protein [Acidimicrobiales bacterium]|nr:Gmad2 immunoglobulin-like domain-containing protein [Acidimicrobiales bacterium]
MGASRTFRSVLLVGALLAAGAACGSDDDSGSTTTTKATSSTTTTTEATTTTGPEAMSEVRAYFLRDEKVGPVAREATGVNVAADAVTGLLEGPSAQEAEIGFTTAIPEGTELLGVDIAGGVATVDLSEEFGTGGGSLSMMSRVAQVVFTLTQFPTVDSVAFSMEGEPVTALGGEGLLLEAPQTRADWEDLSPAILVESPLPFAEVTSPLQVTGTANTFEAVFQLNVTDGEGLIVYDQHHMATSGTGTRGTFDVTATFEVPRPGQGAVIVFEYSAKDGSQINIVEVPVQISG